MLYRFCENNHKKRLSHYLSIFLSHFHSAEKQNYSFILFPCTLKIHEIAGVDFPCALIFHSTNPPRHTRMSDFRVLFLHPVHPYSLPQLIPTTLQLRCKPCISFPGGFPWSSYTAEYLRCPFGSTGHEHLSFSHASVPGSFDFQYFLSRKALLC